VVFFSQETLTKRLLQHKKPVLGGDCL